MNSVPTPDNKGFKFLSHGAQVLWFHLAMRAKELDGRLSIDASSAATLRCEIGVSDEDLRALLRNGFITVEGRCVYVVEEGVWMPGPIVEENGEERVQFIYPGSRMIYWRESLEEYRRKQAEEERKRRERWERGGFRGDA